MLVKSIVEPSPTYFDLFKFYEFLKLFSDVKDFKEAFGEFNKLRLLFFELRPREIE